MECGLSRRVHGLSRRVQHSPVVVLLNGVWSFEQDVTLSFVSFKCSLRFAESHCRTMSTVTDDESHTMTSFMFVLERFLRASWASGFRYIANRTHFKVRPKFERAFCSLFSSALPFGQIFFSFFFFFEKINSF